MQEFIDFFKKDEDFAAFWEEREELIKQGKIAVKTVEKLEEKRQLLFSFLKGKKFDDIERRNAFIKQRDALDQAIEKRESYVYKIKGDLDKHSQDYNNRSKEYQIRVGKEIRRKQKMNLRKEEEMQNRKPRINNWKGGLKNSIDHLLKVF